MYRRDDNVFVFAFVTTFSTNGRSSLAFAVVVRIVSRGAQESVDPMIGYSLMNSPMSYVDMTLYGIYSTCLPNSI